jgi:hypothetical protein
MNGLGWDPELPGGCQDADLEMAGLERAAAREAALRKAGKCPHCWVFVPEDQLAKCHDCGRVFADRDALEADRRRMLGEE